MSEHSTILIRQNNEDSIRYLQAQRRCYQISKSFYLWRMLLSVLTPLISIALFFLFDNALSDLVLIISSLIIITSLILEFFEKKYNKKGAKIQENFDTFVFNLSWNSVLIGSKESEEDIVELSSKCQSNISELENWYTGLEAPDENVNVLIAQRTNICWTAKQKKHFKNILLIILIILIVSFITIAFIFNFTVVDFFITMIFPGITLFTYLIKNYLELREQEDELERLSNYIETLIVQNNPTTKDLRNVQDAIFIYVRLPNHIVPDFLYNKSKRKFEDIFKITNKKFSSNNSNK